MRHLALGINWFDPVGFAAGPKYPEALDSGNSLSAEVESHLLWRLGLERIGALECTCADTE